MSIFKLSKGDFENFTIVTNPIRTYSSSSVSGSIGSVNVFARRSLIEKEIDGINTSFIDSIHDDKGLKNTWESVTKQGKQLRKNFSIANSAKFNRLVEQYMDEVNEQSTTARKQRALDVFRFTPSFNFTRNTSEKLFVKNVLNSYYRDVYPSANWAYSNYHSLNFFTSSTVNEDAALLYPNVEGGYNHSGYASGTYSLSGAFSFDFYINPRYSGEGEFKAGTIFHLSSSYAVSLISGSAKDENGLPLMFRMQLQLSNSADISPSIATTSVDANNNLTFISDDNSLYRNRWQRVIIRWGTSLVNDGTGSFNIDKIDRGTFVIPSGTVGQPIFNQAKALCIGNYYEGPDDIGKFFAIDPAIRDGLVTMDESTSTETPDNFIFRHPLNAEVHDLMIKRYYMSNVDIEVSSSKGPVEIADDKIAFYLPPYFTQESPFRQFVGDHGGIPQTPFFEADGLTNDPINVAMSFGVGGHYINLENFTRDFASNVYPRLHHLTCSVLTNTSELRSANGFLYDQKPVVKRNLLIMPCDDGTFVPNFSLILSESHNVRSRDDLGVQDLSIINLNDLIGTGSLLFGSDFGSEDKTLDQANDFVNELIGFTPEQPGLSPGPAYLSYVRELARNISAGSFDPGIQAGAPLTIFNRTQDASSNQVVFFDMSNLFYGNRIKPGSFQLTDNSLSGSSGVVRVTLKDDGNGNIYRANSDTSHATWNSAGNIYYDEGIVVIKSPHLFFFGQEDYEISFRGEQNVHVMKIDALAPANMLNSSSNPNFVSTHPTGFANDSDSEFVWISGINFHDDSLNIIAKAQLAQPVQKRRGDKISFKVKIDF